MNIGALKPPLRKERTTSRPSVSGSPTSISTRSGASALAALAPLAPVSTAEASNSSCSDNCSTSVSRRSLSSSTIRILRALAIGTILLGAGSGHKRKCFGRDRKSGSSGSYSYSGRGLLLIHKQRRSLLQILRSFGESLWLACNRVIGAG